MSENSVNGPNGPGSRKEHQCDSHAQDSESTQSTPAVERVHHELEGNVRDGVRGLSTKVGQGAAFGLGKKSIEWFIELLTAD